VEQDESKPCESSDAQQAEVSGWKRSLYLGGAAVCFSLGVLGVFLPLLPTTPLLLLTSYFLVRSSPALNRRLLQSKFFGPILQDWQERRGVRRDIKLKSIFTVCIAIAATIYFKRDSVVICTAVLVFAAIGIGVILRLPTIEFEEYS